MPSETLEQATLAAPGPKKEAPKAKPTRSFLSKSVRLVLWCFFILLLLLALVLGAVYFLAGTDAGFARLSSIANDRVAGLTINGSDGNLREGISAENVGFTNETIDVKASNMTSHWRFNCLMQKRFCLDDVHIEQLDITTFASQEQDPTTEREGPIVLPDITLPIDVTISDIAVSTLRFQPPGEAPVQIIENIELSAKTEGSLVTVDKLSLDYQTFATRLEGTVELQEQYPVDLFLNVQADDALPDNMPEGKGKQPLDVQMSLTNTLANLVIDTRISGLAEARVDANVQPLQQNFPATIDITSEELGWPIQSKTLIIAKGTRIRASGDMNDFDISLQTNLAGDQVPDTTINISGVANPQRVDLPAINIDTLGGNASASAAISLAQPMNWNTGWTIRNIDPSIQVPDLQGNLNSDIKASGTLDDGRWSLKLEQALIEGELRELPFRLETKAMKGLNDLWFLEYVTLNNGPNQMMAQGIVGDEVDIKADIQMPQLQNLMPGLAGGFNAKIDTSGSIQSPDISLQADADVVRFNDILIRTLAINGDVSQLFTDTSSLDVTVDSVRVDTNEIRNAALSLSGKRSNHRLTLKADGPDDTAVNLALSGNLADSLNWSGFLDNLQAIVPGHNVSLAEPVGISWQNNTQSVSVAPHCWNLTDTSNVCLQNPVSSGETGQATIVLDQYPLQQINTFLPGTTRLAGELGATVGLTWGAQGPNDRRAIVSAVIDKAQVTTTDALGESINFGYDTIALDANATPDNAKVALDLQSQALGDAQIAVQLNPSNPDSSIDGSVQLQGLQIGIAKAFLPDFDIVEGNISAEGKIGGTLKLPEYDGVVVLDALALQADVLPLPVTGGTATARISGQSMNLDGEILSDEGRIDIEGRGRLDPEDWNAEINLVGEKLRIVSDPIQDSTVYHNIQIVANPRRVSVSGDIEIPQAVIDVEELPEGAATVSSDIVIVEDEVEEQEQAAPVSQSSELNLAVAIDISLGDDVSLAAYGLDANLTGDMDVRIRGNRPPQLGGEIEVVDGIFKKYGQDLVANGQILFVGPIDGTRLDIDAVREIETEDRVAGLRIQGSVATPEITLFTEPSDKSQDAILSYIILGRDINQASDQEADIFATAALALAVKGGSSVGGGVAEALGIKEFGLETRGSGDNAELVVSGRLNDRLLLRYGRDVFASGSTLYLRYDLTKKLYLEAASALGAASDAVDLFYSFSF